MKVAILGSRNITNIDIGKYLIDDITEIISGGASGVDQLAKEYALKNKITYVEFVPEYKKYRINAPLKRNIEIIDYSDVAIAVWDGKSKGTKFSIDYCRSCNKPCTVYVIDII